MALMAIAKFERFFRVAAGLDVNRPRIGGDRFDQITQPWGVGP